MFTVNKYFGPGYSCVFRQWRAASHCRFLHGYALGVTVSFAARQLDENGWVIDFGSFAWIKRYLVEMFDHKLLVARDDPLRESLKQLSAAQVITVEATGCEAFAKMISDHINGTLCSWEEYQARGVIASSVTVHEHGANSATYMEDPGGADRI